MRDHSAVIRHLAAPLPRAPNARSFALILTSLATLCVAPYALAASPPRPAESSAHQLELIVLGSGGPAALGRASSSYVALLDGKPRVLIDAGPGSFARFGEVHLSADALDTVLLTHLHVDHAAELPGFVKSRAVSEGRPIHFDVFGPSGQIAQAGSAAFPSTREFVELLFGARGAFAY